MRGDTVQGFQKTVGNTQFTVNGDSNKVRSLFEQTVRRKVDASHSNGRLVSELWDAWSKAFAPGQLYF